MNSFKSFTQLIHEAPCKDCPAPCCKVQITPYVPPRSLTEIDYMLYLLLFPRTEFIVSITGEFSMIKWEICSMFDQTNTTCKVHGTEQQPLICKNFSPYSCWYKRNFVTDDPPDLYRLNLPRFNEWIKHITFDEDGNIVTVPIFEKSKEIITNIKI